MFRVGNCTLVFDIWHYEQGHFILMREIWIFSDGHFKLQWWTFKTIDQVSLKGHWTLDQCIVESASHWRVKTGHLLGNEQFIIDKIHLTLDHYYILLVSHGLWPMVHAGPATLDCVGCTTGFWLWDLLRKQSSRCHDDQTPNCNCPPNSS